MIYLTRCHWGSVVLLICIDIVLRPLAFRHTWGHEYKWEEGVNIESYNVVPINVCGIIINSSTSYIPYSVKKI